MPDTNPSSAPAWLSASESRLVASSRGAALTSAGAGELKKRIARARTLRDKWRDVYVRQRRETQKARASRASTANQRSREKSELFDTVLSRLEARLEKVEASGAPAPGTRKAARPSPRRRTRQHRRERSGVKRMLAEQVAERQSAGARSALAALPPMQTRIPSKPKKTKKTAKTKKAGTPARKKAAVSRPPSGSARVKVRDQSQSAASRQRTRVSGLTTRIRGHVSGRGKRSQARRDRR